MTSEFPLHPGGHAHNPWDVICTRRIDNEPYDDKAKCCTCRDLHSCGWPEGTFACRVRHVNIAPMESSSNVSRWDRAADAHGNNFGKGVDGRR